MQHISSIINSIQQHCLDGADIDYESKHLSLGKIFSDFLTDLSKQLHRRNLILSCTFEPRTSDSPPRTLTATRASAWANDYAVINRVCDRKKSGSTKYRLTWVVNLSYGPSVVNGFVRPQG